MSFFYLEVKGRSCKTPSHLQLNHFLLVLMRYLSLQENLVFLPSFCFCFLRKNTQRRHTQKERGSNSSKITFLFLTSTLCGKKQAEGRARHAQISPQPRNLCQALGHIYFQPEHLKKFGQRQQSQFFLSFLEVFCWIHQAEWKEAQHAETTVHALLKFVSLFLQGNIPQSTTCFQGTTARCVCWHVHTARGLSMVQMKCKQKDVCVCECEREKTDKDP